MAENTGEVKMTPTLGLTGLTMNAMALIAPGAFLWLTFAPQATEGSTAPSMWIGILFALLLCLATAVCYAEMAKLYPGTGSSYYFAEQSFLNHDKAWKYARVMKFIVGWGSHLYYWIYPGVMVAVTGVFCGYITGTLWPNFMSASNPGPMFMMLIAILFSFAVAYIAHRGVTGSTAVSVAINVIQISALIVFAVLAISYRVSHPPGSEAWQFDSVSGEGYKYEFATTSQTVDGKATDVITRDANMVPQPKLDASGKPVPYHVSYDMYDTSNPPVFQAHSSATSVIAIHNFNWMFVQATVAILILVGFESVTALGGEAKNAKRDVPIAVITSLLVQGAFCYLFEYFAANYFLSSGYPMSTATGSAAPIGDMMIMVGDALFNGHGRAFMLIEAVTVFLALIGTTLSCINTGARVTYAMGKDAEGAGTLRHAAREEPEPSPRDLGPGNHFCGVRLPGVADVVRRCRRSPGRHHQGLASGVLVELRLRVSRHYGENAQQPAHDYAGFQLRDVPALHAKLRNLHLLLQGTPELQLPQTHTDPLFRYSCKPDLHGSLHRSAVHGIRHEDGTVPGPGNRSGLGDLWRDLLPAVQQSLGAHNAGHQSHLMV